jgi:hypothetical protein
MKTVAVPIMARNETYLVEAKPYWHLVGAGGGMLLHNVRNHEGICWSMSVMRNVADLQDTGSLYGMFNPNPEKESVWEAARLAINSDLPPRMHALFLFDDEEIAKRANDSWFAGQNRLKVEARMTNVSKGHRADGRWIEDGDSHRWRSNAEQYWRGAMTVDPLPEIIVHGAVYFPGWRERPFGFFGQGYLPALPENKP